MKRFLYITILFTGLLVLPSCKKFVEVDAPSTTLTADNLFTSDQGAVSAVAGLYSQMMQSNLSFANGAATLYPALSADELANTSANSSYDVYRNNQVPTTEGNLSGRLWNPMYRTIYHCNAILEGLNQSTAISDATRRQVRGEVLTVRAFHYFYLVNLFGDVPYVTTTAYGENAVMSRTAMATVYAGITSDLEEARGLLGSSYPSTGKGRPNTWTAVALLARVYLYQQRWAEAEAATSAVIGSGAYALAATPAGVFTSNAPEIIWQLLRDNSNTAEGATFIPTSATVKPAFAVTPTLLAAFDSGDLRKTAWLQQNTISGQPYYYPFKYKVRATTPISEYLTVLRLGELYLVRAEARARQGKVPEALDDLNIIRRRAGLANSNPSNLTLAIEKERQAELFAEWGHRWLDLKRTGRADAVLGALKGTNWAGYAQLYPIPLSEMQRNPQLTQNPGY